MAEIQDVLDKLDDVLDKINDNKEKIAEVETKVDADRIFYTKCASCNASGITGVEVGCDACNNTGFRVHGKTGKVEE